MKYYAIRVGRKNNTIVTTWSECEDLVKGYKGAEYESFKDVRDAENYIGVTEIIDAKLTVLCNANGCELNVNGICSNKKIRINSNGQCENY